MNSAIQFLQGKKTYAAVVVAFVYLGGAWLGWWTFDERVLGAVGMGGLGFLRSAVAGNKAEIQKAESRNPE